MTFGFARGRETDGVETGDEEGGVPEHADELDTDNAPLREVRLGRRTIGCGGTLKAYASLVSLASAGCVSERGDDEPIVFSDPCQKEMT